jgi:hypothetical protein
MAVVSRLAAFVFAFLLVAGAAAAENLSPRAFTDAFQRPSARRYLAPRSR